MRDHAMENEIWDEGQLGGVEGVLGTVNQLLIDVCIMEELRSYHRNLAVAYYDYKKAYDKVHHDWMLRVFNWMGISKNVTALLKALMVKWKTRLEVWNDGQKQVSRWIQIVCGFLQGDSYSPVGFCLTEVPVGKLLKASKGYKMGRPGQRNITRTHSLFIDNLKTYQENHKMLQIVNETIVQASNDTGACYGVSKCAEIIFERGQMVKGEGLEVLHERMKTIDPDENVTYKFLGVEQADGIKTKEVFERIKTEVENRLELLIKTELNDRNLMKAINSKVIPVAEYPMNVCRFSKKELLELDQIIKRQLRKNNMLGRQSSDERLYLKREEGGRGLKSLRDVYKETKLRVACYMAMSQSQWIQAAWERETEKEYTSIKREAQEAMKEIGLAIDFEEGKVILEGEKLDKPWKETWRSVKKIFKKGIEKQRKDHYKQKQLQSEVYRIQHESCHMWLKQSLDPRKTAAIVSMLEKMIETKMWKVARGLTCDNVKCRVCGEQEETVEHLLAGCKMLAGSEYTRRHNRALMILAVQWAIEHQLIDNQTKWYRERWERGHVLESKDAKSVWDFEFHLRKTTTSRRPDLTLEDKQKKTIWICDMACPQERNIETKMNDKRTKYQQLAFEIRERRKEYKVVVVPIIIGCLGGGVDKTIREVRRIFENDELAKQIVGTMQKTVLMDSETTLRKIFSGLIQLEES